MRTGFCYSCKLDIHHQNNTLLITKNDLFSRQETKKNVALFTECYSLLLLADKSFAKNSSFKVSYYLNILSRPVKK